MKLVNPNLLDLVNEPAVFGKPFMDWFNLTSVRPSRLMTSRDRSHEIKRVIDLFDGVTFEDTSKSTNQIQMDSLDGTIRVVANSRYLSVQFRGSFFIIHFHASFGFLIHMYKRLMEESHYNKDEDVKLIEQMKDASLLNNWLVTRVDIKKDYVEKEVISALPIPSEKFRSVFDTSENHYKFGFPAEFRPFVNKKDDITGWSMRTGSGSYTLTVYDKKLENSIQKNKVKANAYDCLFKTDEAVTRIELRVDSSKANSLATETFKSLALGESITHSEFCQLLLKKFYDQHKCYLFDPAKPKHRTNLDEEPRWREHFNPSNAPYSREATPMFKFKTSSAIEDAKKYFLMACKKVLQDSPTDAQIDELFDRSMDQARKELKSFQEGIEQVKKAAASGGLERKP